MTPIRRSRLPDTLNAPIHQLVSDGHSWRTIAAKLGIPLGTVMARGKELGLKTKMSRCGMKAPIPPEPKPRGKTRVYLREPVHPEIIDNGLGHSINTAQAFSQTHSIPLIDAGADNCRWPIDGDRNPRCCGGPISRVAYCEEHAKRAFTGC
jgi:hypothetical protein